MEEVAELHVCFAGPRWVELRGAYFGIDVCEQTVSGNSCLGEWDRWGVGRGIARIAPERLAWMENAPCSGHTRLHSPPSYPAAA